MLITEICLLVVVDSINKYYSPWLNKDINNTGICKDSTYTFNMIHTIPIESNRAASTILLYLLYIKGKLNSKLK